MELWLRRIAFRDKPAHRSAADSGPLAMLSAVRAGPFLNCLDREPRHVQPIRNPEVALQQLRQRDSAGQGSTADAERLIDGVPRFPAVTNDLPAIFRRPMSGRMVMLFGPLQNDSLGEYPAKKLMATATAPGQELSERCCFLGLDASQPIPQGIVYPAPRLANGADNVAGCSLRPFSIRGEMVIGPDENQRDGEPRASGPAFCPSSHAASIIRCKVIGNKLQPQVDFDRSEGSDWHLLLRSGSYWYFPTTISKSG